MGGDFERRFKFTVFSLPGSLKRVLISAVVLLIFCIRIFKPAEFEKSTYTASDCGEAAMTVTGVNGTVIDVSIVYQAKDPGMYGEHYTLEIENDGEWYVLPTRKISVSNQTMNSHRCSLSAEFTLEP